MADSGHPQRERKQTVLLFDEFPEMLVPMLPKSYRGLKKRPKKKKNDDEKKVKPAKKKKVSPKKKVTKKKAASKKKAPKKKAPKKVVKKVAKKKKAVPKKEKKKVAPKKTKGLKKATKKKAAPKKAASKKAAKKVLKAPKAPKLKKGAVAKPVTSPDLLQSAPSFTVGGVSVTSAGPALTRQQSEDIEGRARREASTWKWEFDGKGGSEWFAYTDEASVAVEMAFQSWLDDPHVSVRAVKSGDWHYMVDFNLMQQQNVGHASHRTRNVRRIMIDSPDTVWDRKRNGPTAQLVSDSDADGDEEEDDVPAPVTAAPRGATSPYMVYCSRVRSSMLEAHPDLTFPALAQKMADTWRALSDSEKAEYETEEWKAKKGEEEEDDTPPPTLEKKGRAATAID